MHRKTDASADSNGDSNGSSHRLPIATGGSEQPSDDPRQLGLCPGLKSRKVGQFDPAPESGMVRQGMAGSHGLVVKPDALRWSK